METSLDGKNPVRPNSAQFPALGFTQEDAIQLKLDVKNMVVEVLSADREALFEQMKRVCSGAILSREQELAKEERERVRRKAEQDELLHQEEMRRKALKNSELAIGLSASAFFSVLAIAWKLRQGGKLLGLPVP
jgi:hypothetical protein